MNMVVWFSRIVEIAADRKKFTPKDNEMSNVILGILEAAGKVDKQYCIEVFEMFVKNTTLDPYDDIRYRKDGLAIFPISQIRTLLESLPGRTRRRIE